MAKISENDTKLARGQLERLEEKGIDVRSGLGVEGQPPAKKQQTGPSESERNSDNGGIAGDSVGGAAGGASEAEKAQLEAEALKRLAAAAALIEATATALKTLVVDLPLELLNLAIPNEWVFVKAFIRGLEKTVGGTLQTVADLANWVNKEATPPQRKAFIEAADKDYKEQYTDKEVPKQATTKKLSLAETDKQSRRNLDIADPTGDDEGAGGNARPDSTPARSDDNSNSRS